MASDITYIKTHEGWMYLAVMIDLFSGRVVGWSAQPRMTTDLALQALLAAVWRRKPKAKVMIHSDQGSQFTCREWQVFLGQHNLDASMSRRGNCHDNAVAESLLQLLKRERIRRRTYLTREAVWQDVFDHIEMFYNPQRTHTNNGMLSPVDFETRQQKLNEAGVQETRGTSIRFRENLKSFRGALRTRLNVRLGQFFGSCVFPKILRSRIRSRARSTCHFASRSDWMRARNTSGIIQFG